MTFILGLNAFLQFIPAFQHIILFIKALDKLNSFKFLNIHFIVFGDLQNISVGMASPLRTWENMDVPHVLT